MADGIVWNLVAKALELLGKEAVRRAASWWGARDDLRKLGETMRMIQARVHDAERRQEDASGEAIKVWLQRLRQVLYRADDLFDEAVTLDLLKQQQNMLCKVGILFTMSGPLCYNIKLANEIKSIRKQLDAIHSDMAALNLIVLPPPQLPMTRLFESRETASFVNTEDVIGRDNEKNMIIEMLFDSKYDGEDITVIPIVGFGGLGKTTLAQLVFNDDKVKQNFDLTKWAYVPDINNKLIMMGKIYRSLTDKNYDNLSLQQIQQGIIESIKTHKYLLVLDDLWDECVDRLNGLVNLLNCGKQGSKVIVTTRSSVVAKAVGTIEVPHMLGTLTGDQSWQMFKKFAFRVGQEEKNPGLSTIGKEIVQSCGNVPLAIKAVGGILRLREGTEGEWSQVRDTQRLRAQQTEGDNAMAVLKLSYDHLSPTLKQCFAYCSLFPKGYEFDKEELIHLWMAQGYFEPHEGNQYFWELVARNLLQYIIVDHSAGLTRYEMHDLLHDLAQTVAGDEMLRYERPDQIHPQLVHVNINGSTCPSSMKTAQGLRTLLRFTYNADGEKLFSKFQSLRVLTIHDVKINKLPNTIQRLIHLRYLYLKIRKIEYLPDSITRLVNLQTLNLESCCKLKELPGDFAQLVNLRHLCLGSYVMEYLPDSLTRLVNLQTLNLESCNKLKELPGDFAKLVNLRRLLLPCEGIDFLSPIFEKLTDLPPGFEKLTSLQVLNRFIVGKGNGIDSLPARNLNGKLHIEFRWWRRDVIEEVKRVNLENNHQLSSLALMLHRFREEESTPAPTASEMNEMLRCLKLPPKLTDFKVWGYSGDEMPLRWFDGLSLLVSIELSECRECKVLPKMSRLPRLKSLELYCLEELEYVEDKDEDNIRAETATHSNNSSCFFPSLEDLKLRMCDKLKGWTRSTAKGESERCQLVFPCLSKMEVHDCPILMSMPLAPKLESLSISDINRKMVECSKVRANDDNGEVAASSSSAPPSSSSSTLFTSLKELEIFEMNDELIASAISSSLCKLRIISCPELRNLRFESPNSIRELEIWYCHSLNKISEGLQHLSRLEKLEIFDCKELELEEEEEEQEEKKSASGWQGLSSLRELTLHYLPKVKTLPRDIGCLTTLEQLSFSKMGNLTEIPQEIGNLPLLRWLEIHRCPKVTSLPPCPRAKSLRVNWDAR